MPPSPCEDGRSIQQATPPWGSLRAYLVGSNAYGDLTLLALRMRASNNLSSLASRKINAIVTRKLPTWTGSAWTAPVATANPAWALADIARASYGAGLLDVFAHIHRLTRAVALLKQHP